MQKLEGSARVAGAGGVAASDIGMTNDHTEVTTLRPDQRSSGFKVSCL